MARTVTAESARRQMQTLFEQLAKSAEYALQRGDGEEFARLTVLRRGMDNTLAAVHTLFEA